MMEASAVAQVEPAGGRWVRAVMLLRDELTLTPTNVWRAIQNAHRKEAAPV